MLVFESNGFVGKLMGEITNKINIDYVEKLSQWYLVILIREAYITGKVSHETKCPMGHFVPWDRVPHETK